MAVRAETSIQILHQKTTCNFQRDIPAVRRAFRSRHAVILKKFISKDLCIQIQREIAEGNFYRKRHKEIAIEICMRENRTTSLLNFLLNDPRLFRFIEAVTDCPRVLCFSGRLFSFVPGKGHYDSWHDDINKVRLIGLSINFSRRPYEGGVFQLRDKKTHRLYFQYANHGLGDAILFDIKPFLQHQVTEVTGDHPRTVYAGWFQRKPSYLALLKRQMK